jgi:hypothetical protein
MKKFLVLTSIIGQRDTLTDNDIIFDNCDYIAITDMKYDCQKWIQLPYIPFSNIDPWFHRRNAKIYKVLSFLFFPNYEYIIWMDGNKLLKVNPDNIIEKYGDFDLALFKHPHRNCLYQEIDKIKQIGYDTIENLDNQKKYYKSKEMPENYGLNEMTCFIKKNTISVRKLELMWWEQICKFSSRDQCSFNYCLWEIQKTIPINIKQLDGFANTYAGPNDFFHDKGR